MQVKINGKVTDIAKNTLTISELLIENNVEMPEMVSVQLNGQFVDKEKFTTVEVNDNDAVDFLYFMGGGENL
ncbi:MAG: sulfur carrier protein ThiS [Bacteroidetes bacterium]|nr:sulfur carrier protein ThiS [Bacteroidota bacterium]